jgi:uncharacterized protein with NAD-binding domain and iron-sulfur cluster
MTAPIRKRVAIVGGGMSAMAAALALTDREQNNAYEVTIYQIGWRLGGQGASGRNLRIADRIEEHGLHLWFGCYDNAFSVMEAVYAELGRTEGPLKNFGEAFKGHDYCMLEEEVGGTWTPWKVEFPPNPERSGAPPTVWSYLVGIIEWIAQLIDDTLDYKTLSIMQQDSLAKRRAWWVPRFLDCARWSTFSGGSCTRSGRTPSSMARMITNSCSG